MDAKLFPVVHPYGTGSVFSEIGSGALLRHIQNRATSLQSWFRRTSTWGFFQADSNMKRQLFFKNRAFVKSGLGKEAGNKFERAFGTVIPSSIPESTAWWRRQSKDASQWHRPGWGTCVAVCVRSWRRSRMMSKVA